MNEYAAIFIKFKTCESTKNYLWIHIEAVKNAMLEDDEHQIRDMIASRWEGGEWDSGRDTKEAQLYV